MKLRQILRNSVKRVVPSKYHPDIFRLYLKAVCKWYVGDQYSCPCCGGTYRKFVPYFIGRVNAVCPGCGSFPRHRLLFLYLTQRTNLFSDRLRILHFAPEYWFQNMLRNYANLDYVSADLTSPLAMDRVDITALPYADGSFDVILCTHVLEHVRNDNKALQELYRVLRPGGWAILQVPLDVNRETTLEDAAIVTPKDREQHYWQADHVRLYGRDFKDRVAAAGFHVIADTYTAQLGADATHRYGLSSNEDIYRCMKPSVAA
jgi:SAM-dependent methyltransferase